MGALPDRGLWRSPVGVGGGRQSQPMGGSGWPLAAQPLFGKFTDQRAITLGRERRSACSRDRRAFLENLVQ